MSHDKTPVAIVYTNHRGETATRLITPVHVWFGTTEWHPTPCWMLHAIDVEKPAMRDFAMAKIASWTEEG